MRFPHAPIQIVIPLAPGGSMNTETRVYTQKLMETVRRQNVTDYRPGAGTTIGAAYVSIM